MTCMQPSRFEMFSRGDARLGRVPERRNDSELSAPGAAHAAAVLAGLASPVSALKDLHAAVALCGVQQGDPGCHLQHLPALGVQVSIILCKPMKNLEEMLNISNLIGLAALALWKAF